MSDNPFGAYMRLAARVRTEQQSAAAHKRGYTEAEEAEIARLAQEGLTSDQIAASVGRTRDAIRSRRSEIARRRRA